MGIFNSFRQFFSSPDGGNGSSAPKTRPTPEAEKDEEPILPANQAVEEVQPLAEPSDNIMNRYDSTFPRGGQYQSENQRDNDIARVEEKDVELSKTKKLKTAEANQAAALRRNDTSRLKELRQEISELKTDHDRMNTKYQAGITEQLRKIDAGEGNVASQLNDPKKWAEAKAAESQVEKLRAANPMFRRQSAKLSWWERTKRRFS